MKKLVALLSTVLLFGMTGAASAYTIDYLSISDGNGGFLTPHSGAQVETFDAAPVFSWSGNGGIVSGSVPNVTAAPFGQSAPDSTNYVSVPNGSRTATGFTMSNYLGLWWGSVDSYNTIDFYNGATLVASITGDDAINPSPANGNRTAPGTNLYVNIHDLPHFDSFTLSSSTFAFEADNIAVGVVPEPGTMMLLGAGFLGLAIYGKRRKNV
ncbi:MAG: hypothetical protein A2075_19040 [Geobacteraceae bacterium GWC2_58_44]|nr:MAG: hypothetical protein A2075_19040 [Geobacteraceae bacterium GWC2_58_44]HBG07905.1 PEP-CTERM sorting domain-containing protein [Geobacter sp.]